MHSIIDYGKLYKQLPEDVEYTIAIGFDDSIVTDTNADIDNAIKLTTAGLMSKLRAIMELNDWPEEKAAEELERIQKESAPLIAEQQDIFGSE